jgi:hypothetical protein
VLRYALRAALPWEGSCSAKEEIEYLDLGAGAFAGSYPINSNAPGGPAMDQLDTQPLAEGLTEDFAGQEEVAFGESLWLGKSS